MNLERGKNSSSLVASTLREWKETSSQLKALQQQEQAAAQTLRARLLTDGNRYTQQVPSSGATAGDINAQLVDYHSEVFEDTTLDQLQERVAKAAASRKTLGSRTEGLREKDWSGPRALVDWSTPFAFILLWIFVSGFWNAFVAALVLWISGRLAIFVMAESDKDSIARKRLVAERSALDDAVNEVKTNLNALATIGASLHRTQSQIDETLREMRFAHRERLDASAALVDFEERSAAGTPKLLRIGSLQVGYANAKVPWPTAWLQGESLVFKAATTRGMEQALGCARNIIWQLLQICPLGAIRFTFIDPVAVGKNFNMYLPIANEGYAPLVVNTKAWTDSSDIEERLDELVAHMENVTQKYLIDFETLEEYNAKATVREPYHLVIIADAPEHLTDRSYKQLVRIYNQGEKCGVYALMVVNTAIKLPYGFDLESIERSAFVYSEVESSWKSNGRGLPQELYELTLEPTPNPQEVQSWIREHGPKFKDAMSVQVTREDLMKASGAAEDSLWCADSTHSISIPLGPSGASGVRNLEFRTSSSVTLPPVNAVLVGRPGSGKSNLMHILITNALLLYGPDELELYLLDFKDGVEFKTYASGNLPHIKVVAIESERQFGLSVLERAEAVRVERSNIFRSIDDVSDLPAYRAKTGNKPPMPRILVVIDEFQQLFAAEDAIARKCHAILESLVRLGRNAGIHTILASQNLVGSLPKSVLDLISVRIALQCSTNDAAMVLAHDNTAAAQLTRPGEAIYNAASGAREGNTFFQVALSNDADRKSQLDAVTYEADRRRIQSDTRVFEGRRAADIHRCAMLQTLIDTVDRALLPLVPVLALGEPMSLTDATFMPLKRQAANNLLIICKEEAMAASVVMSSILSLIAHFGTSSDRIRISVLDLSTADQEADDSRLDSNTLLRAFASLLEDSFRVVDRRKGFPALLTELENTVGARTDNPGPDPRTEILLIFGLHRSRELAEAQANSYGYGSSAGGDEPNLAKQLAAILRDGPEARVHTLVWCDAYANFKRGLEGKLGEFGVRVCGPLNSADAMALVDTTTDLNLRDKRLVKYDEEKTGVIEAFRPYELLDIHSLTQIVDSARKKDARA